ncbi:PREDICTED: uncharacterized protein LOC105147604 [Acromyrmex echinatior]|uniref:uncharacterized protein LOC105147604 n=1 Tax=Acromyrmex echinatior TaxID=103372 RepID=UPI000580FF61|nr:PREDICTED: uncharacterized protein LOC105147604 [Acromyrmex echinatior]
MASKAFVIFVLISIFGSTDLLWTTVSKSLTGPTTPRNCIPGKKYFDGCNTDICIFEDRISCTNEQRNWLRAHHLIQKQIVSYQCQKFHQLLMSVPNYTLDCDRTCSDTSLIVCD